LRQHHTLINGDIVQEEQYYTAAARDGGCVLTREMNIQIAAFPPIVPEFTEGHVGNLSNETVLLIACQLSHIFCRIISHGNYS
jgi:hypothetical protein